MRRGKKSSGLVRVNLPEEIARAGWTAAKSRTEDFLSHYSSMLPYEGAYSIQHLIRDVYLQGVWDGFQIGEKEALKDLFQGEGIS